MVSEVQEGPLSSDVSPPIHTPTLKEGKMNSDGARLNMLAPGLRGYVLVPVLG